MRRITPDIIRKFNPALTSLSIAASIVSEQKTTFTGTITCLADDPAAPGGAPTNQACEIADPSGKFRVWPDIDTMVRGVVKGNPTLNVVTVTIDTSLLKPNVAITATPQQIAARELRSVQSRIAPQLKRVTDSQVYLTKIAAYQTGSPAQQGLYAEALKKHQAADELRLFLGAEIIRLTALAGPLL